MDGRNSNGARISLLNDSSASTTKQQQSTDLKQQYNNRHHQYQHQQQDDHHEHHEQQQQHKARTAEFVRSQSDFGAGATGGLRRPTSLAHYHFGSSSQVRSCTSVDRQSLRPSFQLSHSHSHSHHPRPHHNPPSQHTKHTPQLQPQSQHQLQHSLQRQHSHQLQNPHHLLSHSRSSSFTSASTPVLSSPPTPQLIRSDSSDSTHSASSTSSLPHLHHHHHHRLVDRTARMNLDLDFAALVDPLQRTPSPLTPVGLAFEPLAVHSTASPEAALKAFSADPTSLLQGPFTSMVPQSYLAPLDPVDTKIPTTSTSPTSASSLHQYPALTSRQPAAPFAYPLAVQHQPIMQTSMPPTMPLYPTQPQLSHPSHQPQMASQQVETSPTIGTNSGKPQGKKNQYPCPLAKEYNCHNFFTTSGHAARHAKKHTGKKDAYCPECNKAFTRKDNMEQHRRTHQNGRNASKAAGSSTTTASSTASATTAENPPAKRQKTSTSSSPQTANAKRPKIAPLQPAVVDVNTSPLMIDPSLPISPASSFGFADAVGLPVQMPPQGLYPAELLQQANLGVQASPYPTNGPYYDSNNMSGLDKLAMAASASNEGSRSGSF